MFQILSRHLFDRMITQFALACQNLGMSTHHSKPAEDKLLTYRSAFAGKTVKVGGALCTYSLQEIRATHGGGGGPEEGEQHVQVLQEEEMEQQEGFHKAHYGSSRDWVSYFQGNVKLELHKGAGCSQQVNQHVTQEI
ncbi:expressed unknown protein [Seminavis robusta]|uniref:Uncharacterized protein n=1 Tax=Seminavis robusta TaxID=568900 RepID=A0A9N8HL19_9STRA|nr:expressed unknown protein [Seminavis robusta]|eukprot:Sro774_g200720.1 n/a (137) ;mRNA; r:43964-44374